MNRIVTQKVIITTTGNSGAATGSATTSPLRGLLLDVFLDYHASAPATTDVTLAYKDQGGNILVVSDNKTDTLYAPRKATCGPTGTALTDYAPYPLDQALTISVAQCDALTAAVTAYIRYEERV